MAVPGRNSLYSSECQHHAQTHRTTSFKLIEATSEPGCPARQREHGGANAVGADEDRGAGLHDRRQVNKMKRGRAVLS